MGIMAGNVWLGIGEAVVSRQLEESQQDMKWLQPALRKDGGSWHSMRRGEVGGKVWAVHRCSLVLCVPCPAQLSVIPRGCGGWRCRSWLPGENPAHAGVPQSSLTCPRVSQAGSQRGVLRGTWGRGLDEKARSGRKVVAAERRPSVLPPSAFCLSGEGHFFSFPLAIDTAEKYSRSQGKQKSFTFLGTHSKTKNAQVSTLPQEWCILSCSLDVLSKIHVHHQQLQDSTPEMAAFQWWNHTGMCFSSKH